MKDSLSLLSRGCGRRHNGRLDVCFTPQDYYIRKSQDTLVRLSDSGHLLSEAESTLPKTYSTRRGPLLLYSQDLVTVETSCGPKPRDRKQRVVRRYSQPMEQQLSTLKELTAAILCYSNSQFPSSRLGPPFVPALHHSLAPDLHRPTPAAICATQEQFMPELLVQLNPQWPPLERNTEQLENKPEDKDEEQGSRKRVRLDLFLQVPCSSRTPSPQMEPQAWVHYVTVTPEEPKEHQTYSEMSHAERRNHHQQAGELHHLNTNCVCDVADDQGCSIQDGRTSGDGYERSKSGSRHGRTVRLSGPKQQSNTEPEPITTSGLLPPLTVGRSARHGPCWEKTDKPTWEVMSGDEHHTQRLPPIAESRSVTPSRATQRESRPKADTAAFKSQENVKRLHQQPLFLPLLFPEEIHGKQRGEGEKTEKRHFKKVTVGQGGGGGGGGGRLPSQKGSMIVMQPGAEPPPPPPPGGVMGCVAGRKGPGRQSSLAFLQNQDPCEPSDASRGVVRGLLPLQLRDLQDGRSAGSLILGPDGEIIQLSLYDSQDPSHGDGDTRDQALQVLSAEGEKLPWVIVVQPEHTHAEGGVELHTDIQHHQSVHKRTESHVSVGQFAAAESSFSSEQLLELHRSSNTCSPGSHADPVDVTQKKRKNAEAETWTAPKKDAKTIVRLPPMKEQVEREVLKGDHAETEQDEDEEEQHSTGQTNSLSGSHQQREKLQLKDEASRSRQNINPNKTEDVVDKRKKNTKRKEAEEAAITTGKRDGKTMKSAASDGQKRSGTRKERKWQREKTGSDARPIRSQRGEERTSREAAETLEHSALPSKKKMTNREGGRGEVTMKEEREGSAGRRRRGRLKLKELVAGNHEDPLENKEVEMNQRMEEESRPESTKTPSATQRHNSKTNTSSVGDADISTSADDRSSVRSVNSLISSAAASQLHKSSWRRSAASSCEGTVLARAGGPTPSRGRLSSCSAVMVTEEQLMLNPVNPESSRPTKSQEEEAAALRQRAERRRQEVERERKQQERERTEERMKSELEEERRKRAEELRLKRLAEEEDRRKREDEEQERARREQAQRERERRRQEERRRQMERLQRTREEEEKRRKAELERLRLEEERRQEEESKKLQEMDESERMEYLRRKEQEEEDRRQKEEEWKRKEEEAALWAAEEARLQAELFARQVVLLQQQLAFKRGLVFEAKGLEKTQGISRPWIYSYFTLLQLLGLNPTKAETTSPDL